MKNIFLSIFTVTILLAFGCQNNSEVKKDAHAEHSTPNTTTKLSANFRAELETIPAQLIADKPAELIFTVKNPNGETVKDLQIVHEKPMHLLIVSEDLAEFYHEHPEPQADGRFKVAFTFKNGGNYRLYADFTPKDAKQAVTSIDLEVMGDVRSKVELKPDEDFTKNTEDLIVTMKPGEDLSAGKTVTLDFYVSDANTKKPVNDLQKYLGELAHFVVISQDLKEFVHAHPSSDKNQNDATVAARLSFPKSGLYKIFAQFQRNGKVISVPFTVNVKDGENLAKNAANVEIPKDTYRITANRDGFNPSEISIDRNIFKKLAFVRTDAENCADEVVFKSLKITKKLPVGVAVIVELPKDFAGELSFTCGMDMYKGKIVVE